MLSFECLLTCCLFFLVIELYLTTWAIGVLSLCFLIIILTISSLLYLGAGLFAALCLSTYAPGFLFLSILLLHGSSYWAPAARNYRLYSLGVGLILAISALTFFFSSAGAAWHLPYAILEMAWVELCAVAGVGFTLQSTLLHLKLYTLFILETVCLNLLLLVGLLLTLVLLQAPRLVLSLGYFSSASTSLHRKQRLTSTQQPTGPMRTCSSLRRASRRTGSGWVRS